MAKFWLSTEQITELNSATSPRYRATLLMWIMTKQNFGSLTKEEQEETRKLIRKFETQFLN